MYQRKYLNKNAMIITKHIIFVYNVLAIIISNKKMCIKRMQWRTFPELCLLLLFFHSGSIQNNKNQL